MMYTIVINGQRKFSSNPTIKINGCFISNPSHEQILQAGWEVWVAPEPEPPQPMTEPDEFDIVQAVKKMLASSVDNLTDEEALSVAALYPTWISKLGEQVNVGDRYWYDNKLYKVIQQHTVQEDWTPDVSVSLFTEVTIEEYPDWRQPTGASDSYMTGDKVTYNGVHYICTTDYNVYAPDVYGWEVQS